MCAPRAPKRALSNSSTSTSILEVGSKTTRNVVLKIGWKLHYLSPFDIGRCRITRQQDQDMHMAHTIRKPEHHTIQEPLEPTLHTNILQMGMEEPGPTPTAIIRHSSLHKPQRGRPE